MKPTELMSYYNYSIVFEVNTSHTMQVTPSWSTQNQKKK